MAQRCKFARHRHSTSWQRRACSLPQAFAADLKQLFDNISNVDPELMVGISSGTIDASAAAADEQMNRLVLQLATVAEKHGIRFPRVRPHMNASKPVTTS